MSPEPVEPPMKPALAFALMIQVASPRRFLMVAPPFRKVELDLMFDEGISYASGILDGALRYGFLEKTGSWYSFNGEKIGQGRDNTLAFLKANPDIIAELDSKLRMAMFSKGVAEGVPSAEASELTEV